jgi:hypothetical protein
MGHKDLHEDDWQEEAPLLASLRRSAEPEAPEGYFRDMAASVLARIQAGEAHEAPVIPLVPPATVQAAGKRLGFRGTAILSMVAAVTLLMVAGLFLLQRKPSEEALLSDAQIMEETMQQLQALPATALTDDLHTADLHDEELFAMLDDEASSSLSADAGSVQQDEAAAYLDEVDLSDLDLSDLDIDLEGL